MRIRHTIFLALGALTVFGVLAMTFSSEGEVKDPAAIERISVEEARSRAQAGTAILVCAYNDQKCEGKMLEGALTRREFEEKLLSLPEEQEIIIYCA
jgi:hypothetical protein